MTFTRFLQVAILCLSNEAREMKLLKTLFTSSQAIGVSYFTGSCTDSIYYGIAGIAPTMACAVDADQCRVEHFL